MTTPYNRLLGGANGMPLTARLAHPFVSPSNHARSATPNTPDVAIVQLRDLWATILTSRGDRNAEILVRSTNTQAETIRAAIIQAANRRTEA